MNEKKNGLQYMENMDEDYCLSKLRKMELLCH